MEHHHQQLLSEYQLIFTLSEEMRRLATEEKWDDLVNMEITYLNAVEKATQVTVASSFSSTQQYILQQTLSAILQNESEIKRLLKLRMEVLSQLMVQSSRQKAVNTTYSQFSDNSLLLGDVQ